MDLTGCGEWFGSSGLEIPATENGPADGTLALDQIKVVLNLPKAPLLHPPLRPLL